MACAPIAYTPAGEPVTELGDLPSIELPSVVRVADDTPLVSRTTADCRRPGGLLYAPNG